jgi:tetratricopeptide (TPR) repeat protein
MISSTARDLPVHRKLAMDACLRLGMQPTMMEHLPASDADPVSTSLKMVDEANIYLLVLAHRYGYVPKENNPQQISVTEMEYIRAVERDIPRLFLLMDAEHPLKASDVETGEGAAKLEAFKERAGVERVRDTFISSEDLRGKLIQALIPHREHGLTAFHYVSEIPAPPEPFIAHPYTLLQTHTLVGRQVELKLLTDWVTGKALEADSRKVDGYLVRIMSVIAMGGMGKSALTWKWFNEIAPQEMKPLAGRVWWSFYESDATFENFITRALAYVANRCLDEVQQISAPEREMQLLAALNQEPFLIVLDGLERILIEYARMDASSLNYSDVGKGKSARKTVDPRVGKFFKKLAQVKRSRILVSSRLYPIDLETSGGEPIPGTFGLSIKGLTDEDAVEFWRAFRVSGSRDGLLTVFNTFAKHPLLIQALAGEVKRYRKSPSSFEEWQKANPQFDPGRFDGIQEVGKHVLKFALRGLDEKTERTLSTIAALRMPTSYNAIVAILVGKSKPCATEHELDAVLSELEDRGLVGWDKRANRYDMHPFVRAVVWSGLSEDSQQSLCTSLLNYFEAVPLIDDYRKANSIDDISPVIELYHILIELKRYDEAAKLFLRHLERVVFYRVTANRQIVDLLQRLFSDQSRLELPSVSEFTDQIGILIAMANAYAFTGAERDAKKLYQHSNALCSAHEDRLHLTESLQGLALTLARLGELHDSEVSARSALLIARTQTNNFWEARSSRKLGFVLASRGKIADALRVLDRAKRAFTKQEDAHWIGATLSYVARCNFWSGDYESAHALVKTAYALVREQCCEPCSLSCKRLEGLSAIALGLIDDAEQCLGDVLEDCRSVQLPREEMETLQALAQLRRVQGNLSAAREFLEDLFAQSERGPYRLVHADAYNVLAQIERDEGNPAAAIAAATKAYRLAWCDGPPFAYHWALEKAKEHLKELCAPEPALPPFDESKFEPMPEVEIDPEDEFHVCSS